MHPEDEDSTFCRNADKLILYVVKTQQAVTSNADGFTVYSLHV